MGSENGNSGGNTSGLGKGGMAREGHGERIGMEKWGGNARGRA